MQGDVYYIESEGHNLIYHTSNGTLKERAKMQDAAGKFEPLGFFRSNKGVSCQLGICRRCKGWMLHDSGRGVVDQPSKEERFYDSIGTVHGGNIEDGRIADRHL